MDLTDEERRERCWFARGYAKCLADFRAELEKLGLLTPLEQQATELTEPYLSDLRLLDSDTSNE